MTEAEWLGCTNPQRLLEFLGGNVSERKLRLFACACCRRIWDLLDAGARAALETAERFADGLAGDSERVAARKTAQQAAQGRNVTPTPTSPKWERRIASAVYYATARNAWESAWNAPQLVVEALIYQAGGPTAKGWEIVDVNEHSGQASALRDLFGTSLPRTPLDPLWQTSGVVSIAQRIYEERAFDALPILADALEDASCTDVSILSHCRCDGPHFRGCWVVDLLLGKN
jgi:hypothetical protein